VTNEDYEEIISQSPQKALSQFEQNSAYRTIKKYFLQVFRPTVPMHPIVNVTDDEAKRDTVTNFYPLIYAGTALSDILFQNNKPKILNPDYIVTFPEVQYKNENKIQSRFESFF